MWAVVLNAENPECSWCHVANAKHPDIDVKVRASYASSPSEILETVELTGVNWPAAFATIQNESTVHSAQVIESSADAATLQISAAPCALHRAIRESGLLPQFPFDVSGGCDRWMIVGDEDKAKSFVRSIETQGVRVTIVSSGPYEPTRALSDHQRDVLHHAVALGFYDYPRRITLTRLAEKLGVAKSTLSETLMVIERDIMGDASREGAKRPPKKAA
ncbi:MAG: helix-turn-helix domain-containing protein [Thermoplasmatota archaeon]